MVVVGLASGGLATAAQPPVAEAAAPALVAPSFTDIGPGDVFYDDVAWMASNGITTGWPDGSFRPTASVTREAVAAFLARWSWGDSLIPPCDPSDIRMFTDVDERNPFCTAIEYVAWITESGYPDGTFRPAQPMTREAFAAMLLRGYSGTSPVCDDGPRTFTDVPAGHPFCGYIEMAADWGIVTGWPDGTFRPGKLIERQALAAMLHRADIRDSTAKALAGTWGVTD